jgi:hypothetical protein
MSYEKPKTKKKKISIKKEIKNSTSVEDRVRYLENNKNPSLKKYLDEYGLFFKEKKKSDKSKRKDATFTFENDKLIKEDKKNKKVINLPKYILVEKRNQEIEDRIEKLTRELYYINNIVDFSEEKPTNILKRFEEIRKECIELEAEKLNYIECLNQINKDNKTSIEKIAELNAEERKNRDLYFMIKENNNLDTKKELINEYLESKKILEKMIKKKEFIDKNFLIDQMPSIKI